MNMNVVIACRSGTQHSLAFIETVSLFNQSESENNLFREIGLFGEFNYL